MAEVNAHKMVAHLCKEMANEVYEELAKKNGWYKANPNRRNFVNSCAPTLRQEARQILARMLERNDVSTYEKDKIFEALMLDKVLPPSPTWQSHK